MERLPRGRESRATDMSIRLLSCSCIIPLQFLQTQAQLQIVDTKRGRAKLSIYIAKAQEHRSDRETKMKQI